MTAPEYGPSPVDWVREEVEHLERTGSAADGRAVVVLTTVGARTGLLRKTPLMRVEHAGTWAVVASWNGADTHPAWYANVRAHPRVQLLDGGRLHHLVAREVTGDERAQWWSRACTAFPSYAAYASRTRRRLPVLVLEPPVGVRLVAVDDDVLVALVACATSEASADEVTPPIGSEPGWTPARVAWLRAFHRDRRDGLGGAVGESTWAVLDGDDVVGSVRLRWVPLADRPTSVAGEDGDDDGRVLETGLWLARSARRRGLGRAVLTAVVDEATAAGAVLLRAVTTTGNDAALTVLARAGFVLRPVGDGHDVAAEKHLPG